MRTTLARFSWVLVAATLFTSSPCLAQFTLPGQGGYDFSADNITVPIGESFGIPIQVETSMPVSWLGLYVINDPNQCQPTGFAQGAGVIAYETAHGTIPCDVGILPDHVFVNMQFTPMPYESGVYGTDLITLFYDVTATAPGTTTIEVLDAYTMELNTTVTITFVEEAGEFLRGDVDGDGACQLPDVFKLLDLTFLPGESTECWDAADLNDDGAIDISDTVALLANLFLASGWEIPAPSVGCGNDPGPDAFSPCSSGCP